MKDEAVSLFSRKVVFSISFTFYPQEGIEQVVDEFGKYLKRRASVVKLFSHSLDHDYWYSYL